MFVCGDCGSAWPAAGACGACGGQLTPIGDDFLLGQTIGAYRVARLLGVGGMGRVYKAVHPQIGSRVAIKVLSRECADRRDLVERFFSEARAVNVANHENIVNVLDLAILTDGRPYIVMEFLDGAPLSSLIEQARQRGTPLPLGGVARLAAEVLEALAAAHAKGIVHRDLKPDNIYVLQSGRVKVLDFGVAKLRPELGGSATHTGSLLGTPYYMSPEQASGRSVDARADIYAMGVILFECATLNKPFAAPALFDLLKMQIEQPPPSPRTQRADMPSELEHVILTALAKSPDARFGSARAMSTALQHATRELPAGQWTTLVPGQGAAPSGPWQPTPPASWADPKPVQPTVSAGQVTAPAPRASRRAAWLGLGAFALVAAGVTIGVVVSRSPGDREPANAAPTTPVASGVPVTAEQHPAEPSPVEVGSAIMTKPGQDQIAQALAMAGQHDSAALASSLDVMYANLPAELRQNLPADVRAAIAKYGGFAKMPASLRTKASAAMVSGMTNLGPTIANQVNSVIVNPTTPSQPSPARGEDLISRHEVTIPGFAPAHASSDAIIQFAIAQATREVPDAQLTRIDLENVHSDGGADLTLDVGIRKADLDVRFRSPSHARDPKKPTCPSGTRGCEFRLMVDESGGTMYATPSFGDTSLPTPKCTVVAIWKKALMKHPDQKDAVASISYMPMAHRGRWSFEIGDAFDRVVNETFDDDCR